jgi:Kef-type K+ transport system membrane component KefB
MSIYLQISLVLVIAAVVATAMRAIRQPLIIGHIVTGLLVGPYLLNILHDGEIFQVFSHLGIAFLLFVIGLSLNPRVVREVGKVSVITGLGQVAFTAGIGYFLVRLFGYGSVESIYVAVALTFSSTIIILKLLSDKRELATLHGKIATGFLLVQDLVATLILIAVTAFAQGGELLEVTWRLTLSGLILGGILVGCTRWLIPKLGHFFASSQEFLFLFSLAWGFGVAALFKQYNFSLEIGALVAGVSLAATPYSHEIASKMRPLRDFFIIMFFIVLGSTLQFGSLGSLWQSALALSLFVLVGNPLIVMAILGFMGYTKETGFKSGLAVAQISEFSLVLVLLGLGVGHVSQEVVSLVTLVGLVTIAGSSYLILYADSIYKLLSPILRIFERKHIRAARKKDRQHQLILFGYRKAGLHFVEAFSKHLNYPFLVIDYDPEMLDKLIQKKVDVQYGDANNSEFLDELELDSAEVVISSISDFATNLLITTKVKSASPTALMIAMSDDAEDTKELYAAGANYVIMPHYLGGTKVSTLVAKHGFDDQMFLREKTKHLSFLDSIA